MKVCFIHIPKCGGTSIYRSIHRKRRRQLRRDFIRLSPRLADEAASVVGRDRHLFREELLSYFLNRRRYTFISGHFRCSARLREHYQQDWKFMTQLRDPESRFISGFFYSKYSKNPDLDVDEYLNSEEALQHGNLYVRLFCNDPSGDLRSETAINEAIENLRNFDLVGDLSQNDQFLEAIKRKFQLKVSSKKRNVGTMKQQKSDILTEAHHLQIQEICQPDIQIYRAFFG